MGLGYLLVALLASAVAVFALQNGEATRVRFLAWTLESLPLAALILGAFAAGVLLAGLPLAVQRWRAASRARALEARVTSLEKALGERSDQILRQPSPRPTPPADPQWKTPSA